MSVNSRGTIHRDGHVSIAHGVEQGNGPSSYVADQETEAPRDQVKTDMHSDEQQSPGYPSHQPSQAPAGREVAQHQLQTLPHTPGAGRSLDHPHPPWGLVLQTPGQQAAA